MNVRKIVGSAVITTFVATSLQVAQPPARKQKISAVCWTVCL